MFGGSVDPRPPSPRTAGPIAARHRKKPTKDTGYAAESARCTPPQVKRSRSDYFTAFRTEHNPFSIRASSSGGASDHLEIARNDVEGFALEQTSA
ncbi:hypothetical protein ACFSUK_33175 [Sphingobium scionense]